MNAWRSHGRGTVVLRMSFRGVGRIERSTGFQDPKMLGRLKEMCRTLWEQGRDDVLRDLKAGRVSLRDTWAAYRRGDWRKLPTSAHARAFAPAFETWTDRQVTASYRRFCLRAQTAIGPVATLGDLPHVLTRYRIRCETARQGAMWNRVHSKVRAFLRDEVTTAHELYRAVAAFAPLGEPEKRRANAQRPEEAWAVRTMLGGEVGRIWWMLCCHGLMPDEFFNDKWRVEDGRLHILGTKTITRDRVVPLLTEVTASRLRQGGFASALRRAKLGVTAYDGRRSYGLWCDLADLPEGWKKALLGHQQSTTQMYGWRETERMLEETEPKLKRLLAKVLGQSAGQYA